MQQADDWLGVPQVITLPPGFPPSPLPNTHLFFMHACSLTLCLTFDLQVIAPEEIVDPDVDEHSVMTYLSQFPKAKLKPGAPVKPKQLHPKKANAYGPGGSRPKSLI